MTTPTVGFVCDSADEGWPSMDLVAAMLPCAVERAAASRVQVQRLQHRAPRRLRAVAGHRWPAPIVDRILHRYVDYPAWLRRHDSGCAVFHVLDHSYAHLVDVLPAGRTIVTCHDLDAFHCVLQPERSWRSWPLRTLVARTLRGLRRAATVVCVSHAVREQLVSAGIAERSRTEVIPNGLHPAFHASADQVSDAEASRLLGDRQDSSLSLLHVGLPVPRKRIDRVLELLALFKRRNVPARLVRVGGRLPRELRALAERTGVASQILDLPFLPPAVLAAVYRRADVLLMPSDAEGFGLPVIEALASGTPVVANDLPALRETGGELARYRESDDLDAWCSEVLSLVSRSRDEAEQWRSAAGLHASRFTWEAAAERVLPLYLRLSPR